MAQLSLRLLPNYFYALLPNLIAEQEWDSGGPGAGAGVDYIYEFEGKYYVYHDAGIDEYETKEEALLQIPENEATVSTTIYDD